MLLLKTVALYSQKINNARITYNVEFKLLDLDSSSTKEKLYYNKFMEKAGSEKYVLDIYNEKSFFYIDKKMKNENQNNSNVIEAFVGSGNYYYDNKTKKSSIQKNALGEDFIIESKINYRWELSQEVKRIGEHICFKATTTEKFINRIGEIKEKKIIAWYNPKISVNIGVKNYHGLPGLIMLLEDGSINYKCIKIELNSIKKVQIKKPSKGKIITEEEYNNILKTDFTKKFGLGY